MIFSVFDKNVGSFFNKNIQFENRCRPYKKSEKKHFRLFRTTSTISTAEFVRRIILGFAGIFS